MESINKNYTLLIYGYLFFSIISNFFLNLNLTSLLCGKIQFGSSVIYTFIPWFVIFTSLIFLLKNFPGWLSPFSNTIGYGITILLGIKDIMNSILIVPDNNKSASDSKVKEALLKITSDKSILINEITPENFTDFVSSMSPLIGPDKKIYIDKLYNLVRVKNIIGELVWYILTGLLIISISYNNILNTTCKKNISDMKLTMRNNNKQKEEEYNNKINEPKYNDN
jgi:hypothetical protein